MTRFFRTGLLFTALLFSMSALSLSLQDAKDQGLVGEQPNGYLGIVGRSSAELEALVADINGKRRDAYESIANKNKTPLEAVEQLAGQKAMQKTTSGNYIKLDGRWQKVN
ncbi:MAG: YdbL family protein [Gammaproteobacteria bacterium]|uniref:YdbL family protein n=1 Tax=Pseudomaricurvus alcaniphilus TaxID=1166482 RepID=UPI0014085EC2|nr:YdbL family protein [Pseudomaricurvus alcaniphilus]MBR9908948.1 YdbL family protein [Gammaproteobacteria bacterium]NHN38002.1 YdbL family protein [Pseudomaricurvus alcaniphilus]